MIATPRPSRLNHEIAHGKKIAPHAEATWNWASPAGKLRAQRRAGYLIELGKFQSNEKLLEIGCGTGLFTEKVFTASGAQITAIDISPDLLEQARKKLPGVDFRIEDAMNLSFESEIFDAVYGSSVLHHLDFEKSLSEIYRVLKKGGRMVFAEPNMLNPYIFVEKNIPFIKEWLGDSPDESAVVRWKLAARMKRIGFKNVSVFPYDFLYPGTPSFLIPTVHLIGSLFEKIPLIREFAGSVIIYGEK